MRRAGQATSTGFALALWACAGCAGDLPTGARTVDLGDNFEAPDRRLNEDFFHCVIQPEVLTPQRCAGGRDGDGGGCHLERSALRLVEVDEEPRCEDETLLGDAPLDSRTNLDRIRATVGVDSEASPFYRRPVGLDSHPRVIFEEDSRAAELVRRWIDQAGQG